MSFIGKIIGLYMKRDGRKYPLSEWPGLACGIPADDG